MSKNILLVLLASILQANSALLGARVYENHTFLADSLPKVVISSDYDEASGKLPISSQIIFSQSVYGFAKEDIQVSNGFVHSLKGEVKHNVTLGPDLPAMNNLLMSPEDVSIDASDNIYIIDAGTHRVQVFDQSRNFISSLGSGSAGSGDYEFDTPNALAFDAHGKLYVLDAANYRVQIYDSNLEYSRTLILGDPEDNHNYHDFRDIAISEEGKIFVVDGYNNSVLVFDQTLSQVGTIGKAEAGTAEGEFNYPNGVAVDKNENVYVSDAFNYRVQVFDKNLNYVTSLGGNGKGAATNQFSYPSKVTVDSNGKIHVSDIGNHDVRIFDSGYNFIGLIGNTGVPGTGNGEFTYPKGLALDSQGDIYVADRTNIRVQQFDSELAYQSTIGQGSAGAGDYQFNSPYSMAVNSVGNLYVADRANQRIQIYDSELNYLSTLKADGSTPSEDFKSPYGIHIDNKDKLYIADPSRKRVQVYDHEHNYLATILAPHTYDERKNNMYSPMAVATDQDGYIYIVDEWNYSILKYDMDYNHILTVGTGEYGYGNYEFSRPQDITIDDKNNIYIADYGNERIQIFDSNFQHKGSINNYELFNRVKGIAVDKLGNIYVTDITNHNVLIFDKDHKHIATIGNGNESIKDGQFNTPNDVILDTHGNIYVADQFNNRVQRFDPLTSYAVEVYPSQEGEVSLSIPADIAEDADEKGNEASNVLTLNYNAPPSVYMYVDNKPVSATGNYKLYINFSEQVSGFSSDDLMVENGDVNALSSSDDILFVATITPTGSETLTISLPEEIAMDVSGKGNKAAKTISFTVDNTRPVFQMSTDVSDPTSNTPIVVNGEFSKSTGMLSKSSFQLNNASIDSLSPGLPTYTTTLGAMFEEIEDYLGSPVDIALDKNNHLYVASVKTNRVKIYDENLQYISSIGDGSIGNGNYQFKNLSGVAVDNQGMIYVTDAGNQRVQIYDADKQYVATLGSGQVGVGNNQFNAPGIVDIDDEGKIYVVDRLNYRVQVFGKNYQYLATIGTTEVSGIENNQFSFPTSVAVSAEGMIYVSDERNHRIQVFNPNFEYVATMGTPGEYGAADNQFRVPTSVTTDRNGSIYVTDMGNNRIQKFDKNRNYVASIANHYDYRFPSMGLPFQMTVNDQDKLFVMDSKRVHIFDQNFVQLASLGTDGSGDGNDQFFEPQNVYIDHQQKLYIADRLNHRIQIFDANHNYLGTFQGDRTGKDYNTFRSCSGMAVDKLGNIYVGENFDRHHILIFDQDFNIIGRLGDGTMGTSNEQLSNPYSITFDQENNIYVVDRWNHRVQIFNQDHKYLATLGSGVAGSGNDQFDNPTDIAIDSLGNIYVADPSNLRIQIFDRNRQYKATLGGIEAKWEDNLFLYPKAVTVDKRGNVYVLDAHRVMVFDSELNYLYTFGSSGISNDQFNNPGDIAVKDGKIYVADQYNHRVQIFNASTHYQMTVSPLKEGLVEVNLPANVVNDQYGNGNEAAQFTITYDGNGPSALLESEISGLTKESIIPLKISFSEAVTGFDLNDLKLSNATTTAMLTTDSIIFTTEIVADQEGKITVGIPAGVATDGGGNENKASEGLSFYYDSQPPTVVLTSSEKDTTYLENFPVKIAFSEQVFGFSTESIQLTNGRITSLQTEDSTSFTAEISALEKGEVILNIPVNAAQDRVGYGNIETKAFSIFYQIVDSTEVPPNEKLNATLTTSSESVHGEFVVTLTFDRAVANFSPSNITLQNGQITNLTTSDSINFQLTIMPGEIGEVQVSLSETFAASDKLVVIYDEQSVTDIKDNHWENAVKVYPVPAEKEIIVEVSLVNQGAASFILTTTDGTVAYQKILYAKGNLHEKINISHLPPGIYLAIINTNDKKIIRKVIVQ